MFVFGRLCDAVVDGTAIELALWDTAGQEDFDQLRALSYADTNIVLLCYSVSNLLALVEIGSEAALAQNRRLQTDSRISGVPGGPACFARQRRDQGQQL